MPPLPPDRVTPELARAIATMTAKRAADRPGSYAELARLLGEASPAAAIAPTNAPSQDQPASNATPPTTRSRIARATTVALLGASLLGVIALLAVGWDWAAKRMGLGRAHNLPTYESGEVDSLPMPLVDSEVPFSEGSEEGCLGTVSVALSFIVTEGGEVTEIKLDQGSDPNLAGGAVLFLSGRKYSPAQKDGEAVRVRSRWRYVRPSEFKTISALAAQALLIEEKRMNANQAIDCVRSLGHVALHGLTRSESPAAILGPSLSGRESALRALVAIPRSYPTIEDADLDLIGWSLVKAGYMDAAIGIFETALTRLPDSAERYEKIADGFAAAGNKVKAMRAYGLAASLDPNRESAKQKIASFDATTRAAWAASLPQEFYRGTRVFHEADVDTAPSLLAAPLPKVEVESGRTVSITVSWLVTPEGTVEDPRIVKSAGKDLDALVLNAVRKWTYQPGAEAGVAVPVRLLRKYTFGSRR